MPDTWSSRRLASSRNEDGEVRAVAGDADGVSWTARRRCLVNRHTAVAAAVPHEELSCGHISEAQHGREIGALCRLWSLSTDTADTPCLRRLSPLSD